MSRDFDALASWGAIILATVFSIAAWAGAFAQWNYTDQTDRGFRVTRGLFALDVYLLVRIYLEINYNITPFVGATSALVLMVLSIYITQYVVQMSRVIALGLIVYFFSLIPDQDAYIMGAVIAMAAAGITWYFFDKAVDAIVMQLVLSFLSSSNIILLFRFVIEGHDKRSLWTHSVDHLVNGWKCIHEWECWLDGVLIAVGTATRLLILIGMWWARRSSDKTKSEKEDTDLRRSKMQGAMGRLKEAMATGDTSRVIDIVQKDMSDLSPDEKLQVLRVRHQVDLELGKSKKPSAFVPVFKISDEDDDGEDNEKTALQQTVQGVSGSSVLQVDNDPEDEDEGDRGGGSESSDEHEEKMPENPPHPSTSIS
jgi:hypothetical protein